MPFVLLAAEATTSTLSGFLGSISSFFTQFFTWLTQAFNFVTGQPILLAFVILAVVGLVIAMVKKWIPGRG